MASQRYEQIFAFALPGGILKKSDTKEELKGGTASLIKQFPLSFVRRGGLRG